jgi:Raf kinase inhibitor-like YbhB/YbcL family protein
VAEAFTLTSSAFSPGGEIPSRYTCDGDDVSPPLAWSDPPAGTQSLALVVDDPDAPGRTFTHWLGWGLSPDTSGLEEGQAPAVEGRNDFGTTGYGGPCPPPGHGPHRYVFRLHAVDAELELPTGAPRDELERLIGEHALAVAELIGTYERR